MNMRKQLAYSKINFSAHSTLARARSEKVQRAQQTPPRMQYMHTHISTNQRSLNAIQHINIKPRRKQEWRRFICIGIKMHRCTEAHRYRDTFCAGCWYPAAAIFGLAISILTFVENRTLSVNSFTWYNAI